MHWLRLTLLLLLAALLQVTVIPALQIGRARPDLLLLLAIALVARKPWPVDARPAAVRWVPFWIGWIAGLLADIAAAGSHLPFGVTALVYGLLTLALSRVGADLFFESIVSQVIILAPLCLIAEGALAAVLAVAAHGPLLLGQAAWSAVYSALLAPLIFAALHPFARLLGLRPRRGFWYA